MLYGEHAWRRAPVELRLSGNEVHIWRASLDRGSLCVWRLTQILSSEERIRAKRFYFEQDRQRFIVRRGLLRMILSRYLSLEPSRLQFCYGSSGKPALAGQSGGAGFRFSMSHSQGLALYALTRDRAIGIDLELIRPIPDIEQLAEGFFSPREVALLRTLPSSSRQEAFFNCWTRKEAYVKASGDGLARPFDRFEVSLAPGEPARLLRVDDDPQEAPRWSLQKLTPAFGYAAAIAVEGNSWRLKSYQWPV